MRWVSSPGPLIRPTKQWTNEGPFPPGHLKSREAGPPWRGWRWRWRGWRWRWRWLPSWTLLRRLPCLHRSSELLPIAESSLHPLRPSRQRNARRSKSRRCIRAVHQGSLGDSCFRGEPTKLASFLPPFLGFLGCFLVLPPSGPPVWDWQFAGNRAGFAN
jgi:hypothetical protein